ncbi:PAS domain-containing protein, partial [Patescibacteria group bacterium]|nr:PAS domain-containing protein [Patescibacteria group bacterium]
MAKIAKGKTQKKFERKEISDFKFIAEKLDQQIKQVVRTEKQMYDVRDRLNKEKSGLAKLQSLTGALLLTGFNTKAITDFIVNYLIREMEFEKSLFFVWDGGFPRLFSTAGYKEQEIKKLAESKSSVADRINHLIKTGNFLSDFRDKKAQRAFSEDFVKDFGVVYFLAHSLKGREGKPNGFLLAGYSEKGALRILPEITEEDILLFSRLIDQLALFIENSKISEQLNRTFQQLKTEEEKIVSIVDSLTEGLIMVDSDNNITFLNPKVEKFFLLERSNVLHKIIDKEKAKESVQMANLYKVLSLNLKNKQSKEVTIEDPVKLILNVTHIDVIDSRGKFVGAMRVLANVTREKEVDKMKSEFISIAAHQLRTPLSSVKWTLKMLLDGDLGALSAKQREFTEKGYNSNERMIYLVNDLLDISRIEEGKFGFEFSKNDFNEFMEGIASSFKQQAKKGGVNLKYKVANSPLFLVFDPQRLKMAVSNILDNAIRYTTPGGKVTISVATDGDFIKVSIEDTGAGIPENQQSRVFSKFFRGDNVVRMQTEGTGLGLY